MAILAGVVIGLGGYTFAICFENMVLEGWITEKMFDCFYAGCVPVYWGAPDITEFVPIDAFIDMRAFSGFDELRRFLHALSPAEVRLRVHNLLETRFLHLALQEQNRQLEERVRQRTAQLQRRTDELERARIEILERLARAAEFRDDDTGLHTRRVGHVSGLLAEALGMAAPEVELIRRAAPLHDIGKIGIPDTILLKHGRLSPDEETVMQTHTVIGAEILAGSDVPLLHLAQDIALTHHEQWDGMGYPNRVTGEAIPLVGRIVAVVDVHDALTHPRPYKAAWSHADALAEIEEQAGKKFDPDVVRSFRELCRRMPLEVLTDHAILVGAPA